MKHVIWDWNGTLLDDTEAALAALNEMLRRRGRRGIGMDFYREHFAFPVRRFYALIGFELEREDWDGIAREYHELYARQPKRLNPEASAALSRARAACARQSVLSALRQDLLERDLVGYGVRDEFEFVYGTDNLDGASKLDRARELVERIAERERGEIVMIGDALHDHEVATALGVRCVLCSVGGHAHHRLAALAPTGRTLVEAAELALNRGE